MFGELGVGVVAPISDDSFGSHTRVEVAPTEHLVANRYPDETHQALCGHLIIYLKA